MIIITSAASAASSRRTCQLQTCLSALLGLQILWSPGLAARRSEKETALPYVRPDDSDLITPCCRLNLSLSLFLSTCLFLSTYLYLYLYFTLCTYIYIYIYRERERQRSLYLSLSLSICLSLSIYIYIYIYIYLSTSSNVKGIQVIMILVRPDGSSSRYHSWVLLLVIISYCQYYCYYY